MATPEVTMTVLACDFELVRPELDACDANRLLDICVHRACFMTWLLPRSMVEISLVNRQERRSEVVDDCQCQEVNVVDAHNTTVDMKFTSPHCSQ